MTRNERRKRAGVLRLVGAGVGGLILLIAKGAEAQFGPDVAASVIGILLVVFIVGVIWWQRRINSRKDQPGSGWLDKPPYRPEKPSRWW